MKEADDSTKGTRTVTPEGEPCSALRQHRVALAVAAVVGAAAGAFCCVMLTTSTGDEPPIRVRNGSLELHVLSGAETWKKTGNHWNITGGKRLNDDYQIAVTSNPGAACSGNGSATGTPLRITYFDGTATLKYVELKVNGKHTEVESNAALQISTDKKVLSYNPETGYIQNIYINGNNVCTFTDKTQLDNLLILDF